MGVRLVPRETEGHTLEPTTSLDLHAEATGPADAPGLVLIHPNPLDSACWMYQAAYFSTWYRVVVIDLPGYGRSPAAKGIQLTMPDIARWCWDAVDRVGVDSAVVAGCSVGASIAKHMYHLETARTRGVVLSGTGYSPSKAFAAERIAQFREYGINYRRTYAFEVFAEAFRNSEPAKFMAELVASRNHLADLETIIAMFEAHGLPDPDWLDLELHVPSLIITGVEDRKHQAAFALEKRLPDAELSVVEDAGHACHYEQPRRYNQLLHDFLLQRARKTHGA